jgi:hypothetical protein
MKLSCCLTFYEQTHLNKTGTFENLFPYTISGTTDTWERLIWHSNTGVRAEARNDLYLKINIIIRESAVFFWKLSFFFRISVKQQLLQIYDYGMNQTISISRLFWKGTMNSWLPEVSLPPKLILTQWRKWTDAPFHPDHFDDIKPLIDVLNACCYVNQTSKESTLE